MPEYTTYSINVDEDGVDQHLVTFQDVIGLDNSAAQAAAIVRLQAIIDKITTPAPGILSTEIGVIHPPAVSVRIGRAQDRLEG